MKYILDNKSDAIKSIKENEINALEIKSKKTDAPINTKKILLVGEELKSAYIKQRVDKKIAEILIKMNYILNDDDASDNNIGMVLDEIERLKGIILNKYRLHLEGEEYKALLKRVIMTEEDFRRKYNARQIYRELMMESMDENIGKGR